MTISIPANRLVEVIPGVLGAGGNPLALNAVFVSTDVTIPFGVALPFSTASDVADHFGSSSDEAVFAAVYFAGYENGTSLPRTLYFFRYSDRGADGWLRGGSLEALTLADIQALSGIITIVIEGRTVTAASVNLSSATSFSNAASLLQTGLQTSGGIFAGTAVQTAASTTLTVSVVSSGALHVGDVIVGTGVTVGTKIVSQDSGTPGGVGTYTVDNDDGFSSTAIHVDCAATVTYNSQLHAFVITSASSGEGADVLYPTTNAFTTGLKLTAATGAILSPGADDQTPSSTMQLLVAQTQNWATFMTMFEPDLTVKLEFATWVSTAGSDRYAYVAWDSDATALEADATASFGRETANFNGVVPVWNPDGKVAAFICGVTASIDFARANGRITYAFKQQAGLVPDITNATDADNLIGNGYNFYGSYATANDQFQFLQPGQISGEWLWIDEYVNQIYLNNQLQLAFMELLTNSPSIPYNTQGYSLIRAAALDPINEALSFGTIRAGVPLSNLQAAEVNTAAGLRISDTLQQAGWYLQIVPATAQQRQNRESPSMTLWYMSGGSVQKIRLASIDVL